MNQEIIKLLEDTKTAIAKAKKEGSNENEKEIARETRNDNTRGN